MKHFRHERLRKVARVAAPWMLILGAFVFLKITGLGRELSQFTRLTLMKAAMVDAGPETPMAREQAFDYGFSVRDLEGRTMNMSELRGKVIFLNLWATWCGPCRVEMPSIQKLYEDADKERVAFVMLSLDQESDRGKIKKFISGNGFSFPVYQPATPLPKLLRVNTIPTTFIISPDGKVRSRKVGMADYDTEGMRGLLRRLSVVSNQ